MQRDDTLDVVHLFDRFVLGFQRFRESPRMLIALMSFFSFAFKQVECSGLPLYGLVVV